MDFNKIKERTSYEYSTGRGTNGVAKCVQVYTDQGNRTRVAMFDKDRNMDVTVFPSQVSPLMKPAAKKPTAKQAKK